MLPMELIQFIRQSKNPSEAVMKLMEERARENPLYDNLLNLAKNGKSDEVETIARNIFKSKGMDFDKEFNSFRQFLGL